MNPSAPECSPFVEKEQSGVMVFAARDGVTVLTVWHPSPAPPPPDLVGKGFHEQGFAATEVKLIR